MPTGTERNGTSLTIRYRHNNFKFSLVHLFPKEHYPHASPAILPVVSYRTNAPFLVSRVPKGNALQLSGFLCFAAVGRDTDCERERQWDDDNERLFTTHKNELQIDSDLLECLLNKPSFDCPHPNVGVKTQGNYHLSSTGIKKVQGRLPKPYPERHGQ